MWRVAFSLQTLLGQLDNLYPNRSKISDGGIGDARHKSKKSDHNPWITNKGWGIVTARDFTHDLAKGIDCEELADQLVLHKDERIKYIIWNRQILSGDGRKRPAWKWRKFNGKNPHVKHLHLSVKSEEKFYDDDKLWKFSLTERKTSAILDMNFHKTRIKLIQSRLLYLGFLENWSDVDGIIGKKTERAILEFQKLEGLIMDGIIGKQTLQRLKLNFEL